MTSMPPRGWAAAAKNPCSSPRGPGNVMASPATAGDPDPMGADEAFPPGADAAGVAVPGAVAGGCDAATEGRGLGEAAAAQAASSAPAAPTERPRSVSRW